MRILVCTVFASLLILPAAASARGHRIDEIPNGAEDCLQCHIIEGGDEMRSPFARTLLALDTDAGDCIDNVAAGGFLTSVDTDGEVMWGPELAALDSDCDGYTNGEELGDPLGTWIANLDDPLNDDPDIIASNPGMASSTPCGNNTLEGPETCDGGTFGGASCADFGFDSGDLSCDASCSIDSSACFQAPVCGDGMIERDEECETDTGGTTCIDFGFDSGDLGCVNCMYDTSACVGCGDGVLEVDEVCDTTQLDGATCELEGFSGGTLLCNATCSALDTTGCFECGDDMVQGSEVCDGSNLDGMTCADVGFDTGVLSCAGTCDFDTSGCGACDDGVVNGTEACDGDQLDNETCETLQFDGGTLACSASCGFDTSQCEGEGVCGNGAIDGEEVCDSEEIGTTTCQGLGLESGTVTCRADCSGYDTSACTAGPQSVCGDDNPEGREQCDGGNLLGQTCEGLGFDSGALSCSGSCQFDTSACVTGGATCGNGVTEPGEGCDGADIPTVCIEGGTVSCNADCSLDVSDCDGPADFADEEGCAVSSSGSSRGAGVFAIGAAIIGLIRRRRR